MFAEQRLGVAGSLSILGTGRALGRGSDSGASAQNPEAGFSLSHSHHSFPRDTGDVKPLSIRKEMTSCLIPGLVGTGAGGGPSPLFQFPQEQALRSSEDV